MGLFTIIMADIRNKKGSFINIVLLMAVISMALVSILGVQGNVYGGMKDAQKRAGTGNVLCLVYKDNLSGRLVSDVENHPLVEYVKEIETLEASEVVYKDYSYENQVFVQKVRPGYRLFNSKGTGFLDSTPELKQGEVYISQGMKTNMLCETGGMLDIKIGTYIYKFKIAGIIEDPELGAAVMGWKNIFISGGDYEKIYSDNIKAVKSKKTGDKTVIQFYIYKNNKCSLTDARFIRQVNLDTDISDMSFGIMTKTMIFDYTCLYPKTICIILTVFIILLLVAVIVVICHSVSTWIRMEYVAFGIMKSQGFVNWQIRIILVVQYFSAQVIGTAFGILAAIPMCRIVSNLFFPVTGVVPIKQIFIGKCSMILQGIFLVSVFCIIIVTRKTADISPVRAVSGWKSDIYFDSRIKAAISQKVLSASLAFRQFTSNKRQYTGVILIVSMLVYFMVTMMMLENVINKTSVWDAMGIIYSDLEINLEKNISDTKIAEIEETISKSSGFKVSYKCCSNFYFSINGEKILSAIYSSPEYIKAVSKGRAPLYNNEIAITEITAGNLGLEIGDKVFIGYNGQKEEYIISGLNQDMRDAGVNCSMTTEAASRIMDTHIVYLGYILDNREKGKDISDGLNSKYGDILYACFNESPGIDSKFEITLNIMTLVVYAFSIVFAMIVVQMVCSKSFIRERRDICIYKALGFTSAELRLQFAIRFLIAAFIGTVIGSASAIIFSEKMLSFILRVVGISNLKIKFSLSVFVMPAVFICTSFFLFAFVSSRRIKRAGTRELVIE